jgi:hypothetical protein
MGIDLHMENVNKPRPRSIADIIEDFGRMLTVKELAPLLGESPKMLYARVRRIEATLDRDRELRHYGGQR